MSEQFTLETASELYSTTFQMEYQANERLANTMMERHGTSGTSLHIPVIDNLEMTEQGFSPSNMPISNPAKRDVICEQKNFTLKSVVGYGEKTLFAYDEIQAYAKTHAQAIARFQDKVKIDAILNDPTLPVDTAYTNIPVTIGAVTGVSEAKLSAALAALEAQGVDVRDESCSLWLPAILISQMYNDDKVVNFFYNNNKPLANNEFPSYLGTSIRKLPNQSAGINYIPFTAGTTDLYKIPVVHEDSSIMSYNVDPVSEIVWVAQERRFEIVTQMVCGAKVVKPEGIAIIHAENPSAANP